jgi:hypothetical protein
MKYKILSNTVLALAAIVSVAISIQQAGWKIDGMLIIFELWIISPFILCWAMSIPLHKYSGSIFSILAMSFSILIALFTAIIYAGLYYGQQNSTSSLAFVAVPLYSVVGSIIFLGILNIIRFTRKGKVNLAA